MKKKINIFFALFMGREKSNELDRFVYDLSKKFEQQYDVRLRPVHEVDTWMEKELYSCKMVFFVPFQKMDEHAKKQFESSRAFFEERGGSRIYTYFKDVPEKDRGEELRRFAKEIDVIFSHYYSGFSHSDTVELHKLLEEKLKNMNFVDLSYTYDAFISYRQKYSMRLAKSLRRKLEYYHIPLELQKKTGKKNLKIFRDKDELCATGDLSEIIKENLKNSKFLIVICIPDAQKAPWIRKEIEYFKETHGNSSKKIIKVLAKGEPEEAIPDILLEDSIETSMPDYRSRGWKRGELSSIAASLIGCERDELVMRRKIYKRNWWIFICLIIAIVAVIITSLFMSKKHHKENSLREESKNLAVFSENAYNDYDSEEAVKLALEALPSKEKERPYVPEAKRALLTAVEAYKFEEEKLGVVRKISPQISIKEYDVYSEGEGKYIAILGENGDLRVYDVETGENVIKGIPGWTGETPSDMHIMMCDEYQLLVICSFSICSIDLKQKDKNKMVSWKKDFAIENSLKIDSSLEYVNLSYNSNSITIGLNNGEIIILDKKSGEQMDSVILDKLVTETQESKKIFAKISPDDRYIICRNESCVYLYDRNERKCHSISAELQLKDEAVDEHIIGNFYILAYTKGKKKDICILCYDMIQKKITFEQNKERINDQTVGILKHISFEDAIINGKNLDMTTIITGTSMLLIDCNFGKILSEISFTNKIKGAFLQKYNSTYNRHDYGILPLGYDEDVLTVIFENGECADYSFKSQKISESYEVFESGVIYPERVKDFFLISYKNNLKKVSEDNAAYEVTFNTNTHDPEMFTDGILVYGKMQTNSDWEKVIDDGNYGFNLNAYPYNNGFLIFQKKSCIYYDVENGEVLWENQDINYVGEDGDEKIEGQWMRGYFLINKNPYQYLGVDASEQYILIGKLDEDFSYKIQYLNGLNGKIEKTDNLTQESLNNTSYRAEKISDFYKHRDKIYFSIKLEGKYNLIVSYNLEDGEFHSKIIELKNSDSFAKILKVSDNGQYLFLCEQKEELNQNSLYLGDRAQSGILNMNDGSLYQLEQMGENENILLAPTPCWSHNNEYIAIRSERNILVFSKTGDYEYAIDTKEYTFVGFCFVEDCLYVIGESEGIPMLFRYTEKTGNLIDMSELKGRSGFGGCLFDIESIRTVDSEVILILHFTNIIKGWEICLEIGKPFHNAYIIDQETGKSVAFVQQGAAYNPDIDYFFANLGVVKRYTTEELIRKASKMK